MSEFTDVMRQWRRMCDKHTCSEFSELPICPLATKHSGFPCDEDPIDWTEEATKQLEEIVMAWAAEHPEPIYPSIAKYLEQFGITIRRDGSLEADFFKANEPMSADMAKLLGISSGEGENEKTD